MTRVQRHRVLEHFAVATLLVLCVAAPAWSTAGRVVAGDDRARFVPPAGAVIEPYRNDGYSIEFVDGAVEVVVGLAPIESRWPFTAPLLEPRGAVGRAAFSAVAGATARYQAVSQILSWVHDHIRYELDRSLSQEAVEVLARRAGYCTGVARLSVAMLAAVGIEAREVPGYVFAPARSGQPAGFHRWIEVHYPDRGWVFSDPSSSQQFVPASYLRLARELLELEPGQGRMIARRDRVREIDLAPGAPESVRVRANRAERSSAALVVRMESPDSGEAWLDGEGVRRRVEIAAGEGRFLGIEPGQYELRVNAAGRLAARKRLTFRAPVLAELWIPAPADAVTGGGQ